MPARSVMERLYISLDRKHYTPDDYITVNVHLEHGKKRLISSLVVEMVNKQKISITRLVDGETIYLSESSRVLIDSKIFSLENAEVESGRHLISAILKMKRDRRKSAENTANSCNSFHNIRCIIRNSYNIRVVGDYGGFKIEDMAEIVIHNRNPEKTFVDVKIKIFSFFFLFKRTHLYRVILDKKAYLSGDVIKISCFPTSIIKGLIVKDVSASLYESILISGKNGDILESRLLERAKGNSASEEIEEDCCKAKHSEPKYGHCRKNETGAGENSFNICLKIPSETAETFKNGWIQSFVTVMIEIMVWNTEPLRIKKDIDVMKPRLVIPRIENCQLLEGRRYESQIFEF